MKDSQKKYLDKVVDIIVSETRIDYEQELITHPSLPHHQFRLLHHYSVFISSYVANIMPQISFSHYCVDNFGLGREEIGYVWNKYKKSMRKRKIEIDNER
jgi:hypothetical protein